jgi:hypothetical protein
MYNCYNEALAYLQGKYGTIEVSIGSPFYFRGKAPKQGKTTTFKNVENDNHDDNEIKLLLKQYYLGIEPKKELYFKLVYMGIMEDKENRC